MRDRLQAMSHVGVGGRLIRHHGDYHLGQVLVANNVFGKAPPTCFSCSLNGYDASTYDIPGGRYFYMRADLRF